MRPGQLAGILVEELLRRRLLLPSPIVLEAVIRGARHRAERLAPIDTLRIPTMPPSHSEMISPAVPI